jgi:SAM-dependent methyltransferase
MRTCDFVQCNDFPCADKAMNEDELISVWLLEEKEPFVGWDFSHLDGRMLEDQAPWSYSTRAAALMRTAASVIDLDTGGGERLLGLRAYWPPTVVATEGYPPNVKLVHERLGAVGVRIVEVSLTEDGPMPFADGEFELVLNRHAGFNSAEVARILAPGGAFLTQQVHGLWAQDLLAVFGAKPKWPDATPGHYVPRLQAAGLTVVDVREWSGGLAFTDVGAIVYYLMAVPWLVPGFTVSTHLDQLLQLQQRLDRGERLIFAARKYLIEAHKA